MVQAVLLFAVAFIYANLGLGGGLLFVPILLSTGVTSADVAVPISLTLTMATASASVINHQRKGLVDFWLGRTLVAGALVGAILGTLFTLASLVSRAVGSGGTVCPPDFLLIPILFPVVFIGAFLGSRWGLRALRTRPVAMLFILLVFVAAAKLVYDLVV